MGELQRGRGAGYLRAVDLANEEAQELLRECIFHDPRMDRQVESRAKYYATLAYHLSADLEPIAKRLAELDGMVEGEPTVALALDVLDELGRLGVEPAFELLCDYLRWGAGWGYAVTRALGMPDPARQARIARVIEERAPSEEEFARALQGRDLAGGPWAGLAGQSALIHEQVVRARERMASSKVAGGEREEVVNYDSLTVRQLLAAANSRNSWGLRTRVARMARPADVDLLVASVSSKNLPASFVAFGGLAELAPAEIFEWIKETSFSAEETPHVFRAWAWELMAALPAALTLPLARETLNDGDWRKRGLAERVLKRHATVEDVPLLRAAIAVALAQAEEEAHYRLCHLADAFDGLPGIGVAPELVAMFRQSRHSLGRARAAKAMGITAPEAFRDAYAMECLWDCEAQTRHLGCQWVTVAGASVRYRLKTLADDRYEVENVRGEAAMRLNPGSLDGRRR